MEPLLAQRFPSAAAHRPAGRWWAGIIAPPPSRTFHVRRRVAAAAWFRSMYAPPVVMSVQAWPSVAATTSDAAPAKSAIVAWVPRRPRGPTFGTPASLQIRQTCSRAQSCGRDHFGLVTLPAALAAAPPIANRPCGPCARRRGGAARAVAPGACAWERPWRRSRRRRRAHGRGEPALGARPGRAAGDRFGAAGRRYAAASNLCWQKRQIRASLFTDSAH